MPMVTFGAAAPKAKTAKPVAQAAANDGTSAYINQMNGARDVPTLDSTRNNALDALGTDSRFTAVPSNVKQEIINETKRDLDSKEKPLTPEQRSTFAKAQKNYEDAVAKEQSEANKNLEAFSIATMGLGGMQLAQGISEKLADSAADKDMDNYINSMRCTYGSGQSVKWGTKEVSLPGGDGSDIMKYKNEYFALAKSLKQRKAVLELKAGIESEEILDKATAGLYDDENIGITDGQYASRYRAKAGNEEDTKELADQKKEAKTRMIAGGAVAGAGLIGSMTGNSINNGKLGELMNNAKGKGGTNDSSSGVSSIINVFQNSGSGVNNILQQFGGGGK